MLLLLILDFCTEVSLIHFSVTLYSLMFPIPLPKLIEVPELTRAPIKRLCQNVLSICPEKCIFASARAPIPICTTDEEGRILDCPVNSNISCLLSFISLTPFQESEKLDIWSSSRARMV